MASIINVMNTELPILYKFWISLYNNYVNVPNMTGLRAMQSTVPQMWFQKWHGKSHYHSDEGKVEGNTWVACPNVWLYNAVFTIGTLDKLVHIQLSFVKAAWYVWSLEHELSDFWLPRGLPTIKLYHYESNKWTTPSSKYNAAKNKTSSCWA